jgi:hypothetical protein
MLGQVDKAMKSLHNFHQVWKQFGGLPEFYNIVKNEAYNGREGYPLRPGMLCIYDYIDFSATILLLRTFSGVFI